MSKKTSDKNSKKGSLSSEHYSFLAILIVFAGVSLFGIFSFFNSTNDYINYMYASVIDGNGNEVVVEETKGIKDGVEGESAVIAMEVFNDVASSHTNAKAIEELYYAGIIKGYNDGGFRPDNTITRAEFWAVVTNAIDADFSGQTLDNCFTDVRVEWYAAFVCYAKEQGWVKGFDDGSYRPNQPVTKAEALKMILGAFGYEVPTELVGTPYKDVVKEDWFAPYAYFAREKGIVSGTSFFAPSYNMGRGDIAQMIYTVMVDKGVI